MIKALLKLSKDKLVFPLYSFDDNDDYQLSLYFMYHNIIDRYLPMLDSND